MAASLARTIAVVTSTLLLAASALHAQPVGFVINSNGNFEDDDLVFALWRVDLANGEAEVIGSTRAGDQFFDIEGLSLSTDGFLYGADDSSKSLVRISPSTATTHAVGFDINNMGVPLLPNLDFGITFTCTGDLLVSSAAEGKLYHANPATGLLTELGDMDVPIVDLAIVGPEIYGIGQGSEGNGYPATPNLYRIDPTIPSASLVGPLGDAAAAYLQAGLAADASGQLWAVTNRNDVDGQGQALASEILRIDRQTGQAEKVAETIVGIESLAIVSADSCDPPEVPDGEPQLPFQVPALGPAGLVLLALALLFVATRRSLAE